MTDELWQLYDENGNPIKGKGSSKEEVYKGLLHGASHVWVWRGVNNKREVLVQKRANTKGVWPNLYDISAAGHINLGEEPISAAVRETNEEIGLDIPKAKLKLLFIDRSKMYAPNNSIENEYCWVYLSELTKHEKFNLQESEVSSLHWKNLDDFKKEVLVPDQKQYVPHGIDYFNRLILTIESEK